MTRSPEAGTAVGVTVSQAVGNVLSKVGEDIQSRQLAPREQARIGVAAFYAFAQIEQHLKDGKQPRGDGFFESPGNERSRAEELFEGVLLKARDAYEEKKARYLGTLYGNVAFEDTVSSGETNLILNYAADSTYRGLVCMAMAMRRSEFNLSAEDFTDKEVSFTVIGILHELQDLSRRELLFKQGPDDAGAMFPMDSSVIVPAYLHLGHLGNRMYELLGLQDMPGDEIEFLVAQYLR